jgi:MoxR-like ATPase
MLRVVLERVVGDLKLPDGVRVIAAANPPEDAADGWELAPPLSNRLVHLNWPVNAHEVSRGLAVGFPRPPLSGFQRPPSEAQILAARSSVAAFLKVRPALVLQLPKGAGASQGWPSPRSWEMVTKLVAACEAVRADKEVLGLLVAGAVGEGTALEFLSWMENLDLPDPVKVLADPDSFEMPGRSDRAFAVLTSVASVAVAANDTDTWNAAWLVVAKAARTAPDVASLVARTLATRRPPGAQLPSTLRELLPVLRDAGLIK